MPKLKARPHVPHPSAPAAIPVVAEALDTDEEDDEPESPMKPQRLIAVPSQASSSVAVSFVADVFSGKINGSLPESAGIALPTSGAALVAAGPSGP